MKIDQILRELEKQKASIERAIDALKEVSASGFASQLSAAARHSEGEGKPVRKRIRKKQKRAMPAYTDEYRRRVVSAVRGGMTFGEAARKFDTTWFSVREWVNSGRFEPEASAKKSARKKSAPRKAAKKPAQPVAAAE